MMMYPTLLYVSANINMGSWMGGRLVSSLEKSSEVIQLIPIKLEILLHARDVGIILGNPVRHCLLRDVKWDCTMFVWSMFLNM